MCQATLQVSLKIEGIKRFSPSALSAASAALSLKSPCVSLAWLASGCPLQGVTLVEEATTLSLSQMITRGPMGARVLLNLVEPWSLKLEEWAGGGNRNKAQLHWTHWFRGQEVGVGGLPWYLTTLWQEVGITFGWQLGKVLKEYQVKWRRWWLQPQPQYLP